MNGFQEGAKGGISFSAPAASLFGGTTSGINSGYSFDLPLATVQSFTQNALSFSANNSANAQGFLSGVISGSQKSVTQTAETAFGMQNNAIKQVGAMSADMGDTIRSSVKLKTRGCYITTAVCEASGLPDDCESLETLRNWRDNYLAHLPHGKSAIEIYYATAPRIVDTIKARPDHAELFLMFEQAFIRPAVIAIKRGDNQIAEAIYIALVNVASMYSSGEA